MLHSNREELHGITVVISGRSGRTYLGRFHETTERGVVMRDVAIHDQATALQDLATWMAGARKYGIPASERLLVVPHDEVVTTERFDNCSVQ